MKPEVEYLSDDSIDEAGDQELRGLLSTCFTKPGDEVFRVRRYWREPYKHRWVIRDAQGALIAHVGLHEKAVVNDGASFRIGGICEVCVHPDYRGRGYVRSMLGIVHAWLARQDIPFAVLFGEPAVYGSSGYTEAGELFLNEDMTGWKHVKGMFMEISDVSWPDGDVHLVGLKF